MIPKIIHYCWFGRNPLPPLALECIASWRKFLPEYEVWQWSEQSSQVSGERLAVRGDNVADKIMTFDVNSIPYTEEAYRLKKYAFVSDYCRFVAMYEYGGIYFDTDVEVIRPMDEIVARGNFMGFEVDPDGENTPGRYAPRYCFAVNPGLGFGMEAKQPFMKEMIDLYHGLVFEPIPKNIAWYKTIVAYTTEILCSKGLMNIQGIQHVDDITIYPCDFFAPINSITNRLQITQNTKTIHRYAGSWGNGKSSVVNIIRHYLPDSILKTANKIKRRNFKVNK